jgi:hypothetical protein
MKTNTARVSPISSVSPISGVSPASGVSPTSNVLPFPAILTFPSASNSAVRRALRRDLLSALRASRSAVVVDLSHCATLNHDDIGLLLECVAEVAGRDTQLLFVAGSRTNRVILEITRISSLAHVFNSAKEALAYQNLPKEMLAYPRIAADQPTGQSQERWSA